MSKGESALEQFKRLRGEMAERWGAPGADFEAQAAPLVEIAKLGCADDTPQAVSLLAHAEVGRYATGIDPDPKVLRQAEAEAEAEVRRQESEKIIH